MSAKLPLSHDGHNESDEDCDMPNNKHEHIENDFSGRTEEIEEITIKQARAQETSLSGVIGMIDTYDRPAGSDAEGLYAEQGAYSSSYENKPGQRIPKVGYSAEAGFGRASAEYSIFEAEARGPNAGVKAEASLIKVGAMARAEVASASAKAGPVAVKVGLGLDTGASVGLDGVEVKFMGTGLTIGSKMGVSLLGSEASVSCSVM